MECFRRTIYILVLVVLLGILNGCNQQSTGGGEEGIYEIVTFINGTEYVFHSYNDGKYLKGEFVGEITSTVKASRMPVRDGQSNYFDQGTKVYTIEGEDHLLLAESPEETIVIQKRGDR